MSVCILLGAFRGIAGRNSIKRKVVEVVHWEDFLCRGGHKAKRDATFPQMSSPTSSLLLWPSTLSWLVVTVTLLWCPAVRVCM